MAQVGEPLQLLGARNSAGSGAAAPAGPPPGAQLPAGRPEGSPLAPPVFGRPPGFGTGTTGFLSSPPPPSPAGTEETEPAAAPGTAAAAPAAAPLRRTGKKDAKEPKEGENPFEPIGIRAGAFVLRPAIEASGGYHTNAEQARGGAPSAFTTVAPELVVKSDWNRHALNLDLRGSYTAYKSIPSINETSYSGRVDARIDVSKQTRIEAELRTRTATESVGSPDLPVGLAALPFHTSNSATLGAVHRFNRLEISAFGSVDRTTYEDSQFEDGSSESNEDRNYNRYAGRGRIAYDLLPGVEPFAEVEYDRRIRDVEVDRLGLRRSSYGVTARAGTTFTLSGKLTGSMSLGYAMRSYEDPTLPELTGFLVDGTLVWAASGLTTVTLSAKSDVAESTLPGVAGVLRRDVELKVDHDFRRWLTGTVHLGYGTDSYQGSSRHETRYLAAFLITYRINREIHLKAELRQDWSLSSIPGEDYTSTTALIGMRLQR